MRHFFVMLLAALLSSACVKPKLPPSPYADTVTQAQYHATVTIKSYCGDADDPRSSYGTGVMVAHNMVLTAKHVSSCWMSFGSFYIDADTVNLEIYEDDEVTNLLTTGTQVYEHPTGDWALVKLNDVLADKPLAERSMRHPYVGEDVCEVGGYPRTKSCQEVYLVDEDKGYIYRHGASYPGNSGSAVYLGDRLIGLLVMGGVGLGGKPYNIVQMIDWDIYDEEMAKYELNM